VNESALAVDVLESDVGPINKAALHLALTVAAFLVEDQVPTSSSARLTRTFLACLIRTVLGPSLQDVANASTFCEELSNLHIGMFSRDVQMGHRTVWTLDCEARLICWWNTYVVNAPAVKMVLSSLQVNHGILKDGFPLPDIPNITVDRANITIAPAALALGSDFSYKS